MQCRGLNAFCIELRVRALVIDQNYLEHQKLNGNDDAVVKEAEIGLATAFSSLVDLVVANVGICRECALTAFSYHPTEERLKRLVELAALPTGSEEKNNGSGILAVVGKLPTGSGGGCGGGSCLEMAVIKQNGDSSGSQAEDEDSGVELSGGSHVTLMSIGSASPVAASANKEVATGLPYSQEAADSLDVSLGVIQDLAIVVHSQRWQVLSWRKDWEELKQICVRYVSHKDEMRSVTKDLINLNPDLEKFKVKSRFSF